MLRKGIMHNPLRGTRRLLDGHAPALFALAVIVLALNAPLLPHLRTHAIGNPSDDVFEILWQFDWLARAVLDLRVNPFYAPGVFYPQGWHLASGGYPAWYFLPLGLLGRAIGPVLAYNQALLATLWLSAYGAYRLAHLLCGERRAALVAGCIYLTAPVLTLRWGGHLNILMGAAGLPFVVYHLVRLLRGEGRPWAQALATGAWLAATVAACWYFAFIATLPLAVLVVAWRGGLPWRRRLPLLLAAGALCAACLAPAAWLTARARAATFDSGGRFLVQWSDSASLSPDGLLHPNPLSVLWRVKIQRAFPLRGEEDVVAIGYVALALAAVGLARRQGFSRRPWVAMLVVALLLAMGTSLHWNSERVELAVSPAVSAFYQRLAPDLPSLEPGRVPILLPGYWLARYVPFYDAMRIWARYEIVIALGSAVLAAVGLAALARRAGRWGLSLCGALCLAVLLEGAIIPYAWVTPVAINARPQVNAWLAAQPEGTALIEYPLVPVVEKLAMYSQALHHRSVVNGSMSYPPSYRQRAAETLGTWPNAKAVKLLRAWGVDLVVMNGKQSDPKFAGVLGQMAVLEGVEHVASFSQGYWGYDAVTIWRMVGPDTAPTPDAPRYLRGFWLWETNAGDVYRWTDGDAHLLFGLPAGAQQGDQLCLALHVAAARPPQVEETAHLQVRVGAHTLFETEVPAGSEPRTLAIPVTLATGDTSSSLEVALISNVWRPSDYLQTGDGRNLGVLYFGGALSADMAACQAAPLP